MVGFFSDQTVGHSFGLGPEVLAGRIPHGSQADLEFFKKCSFKRVIFLQVYPE